MRSHVRVLACAAVLLCAAGCGTPPPPPGKAAAESGPPSVQAFSINPFASVALPASRMQVHTDAVKVLGRPRETLTRDAPSEHDPRIVNSIITLRYAFGDLVYLHVAGKDVENLILIQLRGNQLPLKYGIRLGETTREQIVKLFGPPQDTQENSVSYNVPFTQEIINSTTFYFREQTLLQIDISSLMMD